MSKISFRRRRTVGLFLTAVIVIVSILLKPEFYETSNQASVSDSPSEVNSLIEDLEVKGRAPKTGYSRSQFGDGWSSVDGCDTRNIILYRDLTKTTVDDECKVLTGVLNDPYTGQEIKFVRGAGTSDKVQIDHVVALSNAWQTGAQQISREKRVEFANDPLNLLAVDGPANQQKSDGDAATWLPSNKVFRCQYVERQMQVKKQYNLWVTAAEKLAIERVLSKC